MLKSVQLMTIPNMRESSLSAIEFLETEEGILASSKEEIYGCIFGRDSLITAMNLLAAYEESKSERLLSLAKKILLNLAKLQGQAVNIESGEQPGKIIHEYRKSGHEHLTKRENDPWYLYPDGVLRNYDSVDSTPLFLIAAHMYHELSGDDMQSMLSSINLALGWLMEYGDSNSDGLIDYEFHSDRKSGGLPVQNWIDSHETLFHEDGTPVKYPIAPIEVQSYSYVAYELWQDYMQNFDPMKAARMRDKSKQLREAFQQHFAGMDGWAVDGNGKLMTSKRSNFGHVLWSCRSFAGKSACLIDDNQAAMIVDKLMQPDIFEQKAGIRTLSKNSSAYRANSYHNGSIWPHDNLMIAEGFESFGYNEHALNIRKAMLNAYQNFSTPLELFVYDDYFLEYCSPTGQTACRIQAWSASGMFVNALKLQKYGIT
jgi:glycogen debranching enzyme